MISALLICGPTASGKSALALRLAAVLNGHIINADAMQVYSDCRLLTARPSESEESRAPHHLFGHVSGAERYSVGRWLSAVAEIVAEVRAARRLPVIVGGTGLYFKALLEGLAPIPAVDPAITDSWHTLGQQHGVGWLSETLARRDQQSHAAIAPADSHRLIRALSVLEATGLGMHAWRQQPRVGAVFERNRCAGIIVARDPQLLTQRIERRFDDMIEQGALAEVRGLLAAGYTHDLPLMRAVGVPPLSAFIEGRLTWEEAVRLAKRDTRRFAKRQRTWQRHQMEQWASLDPDDLSAHVRLEACCNGDSREFALEG